MTQAIRARVLTLLIVATFFFAGKPQSMAQSLQVTYGGFGIQTISYAGRNLEDVGASPGDSFHIWHMKCTDGAGNAVASGQYGWGENNNGRFWDPASHTATYQFSWGTLATQFVQVGDQLNIVVTETNNSNSGVFFDGAEVYPFALHFPQDPAGFSGYTQYSITSTGPGVSAADFGSGVATTVLPVESSPFYTGWKSVGVNTYSPIFTSTPPDGLPAFLPHFDHPVAPGSSFSYTLSVRFSPEGAPIPAADAYASFAAAYPNQMTWADRRMIGTAYLASSPSNSGDKTQPGGFPSNPRRYFNDPSVDITTSTGLQAFQARILAQAASNVVNSQALNAQAVITWDLEGEQYPQDTSYVCSPDQVAAAAPEMESLILNPASEFAGQRLDDAYFRIMTRAGLHVGLCLRPQVFTKLSNGTASQQFLSTNAAIVANLEHKAIFANTRWGATIFYVDSTVDVNGGTLDPAIFQQLITDLPGFLFIPEESTPRYYAYSAPFYSFIFHQTTGTDSAIYNIYPHAFGATLVNDVDPNVLATFTPQLTSAVAKGDILMGHVDWWQPNDPTLIAIERKAAYGGSVTPPTPPPSPTKPVLSWPSPNAIVYGTPLSSAQLDASASALGVFTYTPAAGIVLPAGTSTLLATFTPADAASYTSATASVPLTIQQAAPIVAWASPASITVGTALSSKQLNATANVPGTFTYSPSVGTVLPGGTSTLFVTFTPAATANYTAATASVTLNVLRTTPKDPALTWSSPAPITYGTPLTQTQLNASAAAPGTFTYLPAPGTVLSAGTHTLQVAFTPADSAAYTSASASVNIFIQPAAPVLTWATPASITAGTALSGLQLDASANVPGTFLYTPAAGTVLSAGSWILTVAFRPADSANQSSQTATVLLRINPLAVQTNAQLAILSPSNGSTVSGVITVTAQCLLPLDSAGSYIIVDGISYSNYRASSAPYVYPLDTTKLTNGLHTLQIWAHDIGNNVTISAPSSFVVAN